MRRDGAWAEACGFKRLYLIVLTSAFGRVEEAARLRERRLAVAPLPGRLGESFGKTCEPSLQLCQVGAGVRFGGLK